jgi:hypothetical protein
MQTMNEGTMDKRNAMCLMTVRFFLANTFVLASNPIYFMNGTGALQIQKTQTVTDLERYLFRFTAVRASGRPVSSCSQRSKPLSCT